MVLCVPRRMEGIRSIDLKKKEKISVIFSVSGRQNSQRSDKII